MNKELTTKGKYQELIESIGGLLHQARQNAFHVVNSILVKTYWEIGRQIVVFEQKNKEKADYGSELMDKIAADLKKRHGKGFSRSNVFNFRRLYFAYPKIQTLSGLLSWSHIVALLGVSDDLARTFYEKECVANRWSVRELERQINSRLFERLALSRDKEGVLKLAEKGQIISRAQDVLSVLSWARKRIMCWLNMPWAACPINSLPQNIGLNYRTRNYCKKQLNGLLHVKKIPDPPIPRSPDIQSQIPGCPKKKPPVHPVRDKPRVILPKYQITALFGLEGYIAF